jgi:hypothetical protein
MPLTEFYFFNQKDKKLNLTKPSSKTLHPIKTNYYYYSISFSLKPITKKMNTRSQTRANREAAQRHVENYLASVRAKKETTKKATTATAIETPQKQPEATEPQINAPTKKPRALLPKSTGYRTRLSTGAIERKKLNVNLSDEFDAEFFDDASKAWNENKTKLGNGMYSYIITRSASKVLKK